MSADRQPKITGEPPGASATRPTAGTPEAAGASLRLFSWRDRQILALALAALAGGFGQFGAVAALGDVAKTFGEASRGATLADQAGLSGTVLGVGLAVIRLASLGGLPVAGLADRLGRRRLLISTLAVGLALTALASLSPGYWWFVVIFACGRPLLSGADAVAQVSAAEHTATTDRTKAVALVAAGYGVGAGLTAVVHSLAINPLGFRGLFALALVPLVGLLMIRGWITEPDRFHAVAAAPSRPTLLLGALRGPYCRRLVLVATLSFALSVITGPGNSFVFLYAQDIVHQPGYLTALMVVGAGAAGLAGLAAGQWMADRVGRRFTATLGMIGIAGFGLLAYSGRGAALTAGYVLGVLSGSLLAPAVGALVNELFPTAVRASAAGWWVAAGVLGAAAGLVMFGALADVGNRFSLAALVTFLPAAALAGLFWLLPETRGREPEQLEQGCPP